MVQEKDLLRGKGGLILPFFEGEKEPLPASTVPLPNIGHSSYLEDFRGKKDERLLVYGPQGQRYLCFGLGKQAECSPDSFRLAYYHVAQYCMEKKWESVSMPQVKSLPFASQTPILSFEGWAFASYVWPKQKRTDFRPQLHWIDLSLVEQDALRRHFMLFHGVMWARDVINESAHTVTPEYLAQATSTWVNEVDSNVDLTIWGPKEIQEHNMGLFQAVSQGASVEPRLIVVRYTGNPHHADHTVLVGKGVTFDTGGLDLKTSGMATMRGDMSGAAAVLATLQVAARLKLPINVTAVVPATENAIGPASYKPGDVFQAYDGSRVEVGDTDAEGRLILADALSYALQHLAPSRVIDLATLTGSVVVALGDEIAGLFCNQDLLANQLMQAADQVGEPLWRMPLYAPYTKKLESFQADLCNIGGRAGGSITGALFLNHFVKKHHVPWAHIDCAGPAFLEKPLREWGRGGIGWGVRLLISFLENLSNSNSGT